MADIGRQVGKRVSEKSPGDCTVWQILSSRRSSLRVFRPRRPPRPPFERWSIFPSRQAHSARRHAVPVLQLTTVQSPTEHPSEFPSDTLACSRTNIRHQGCDTSYPGGRGPSTPIYLSATKRARNKSLDGTHDEQATLVIYVLLQRCLQET